jgi:hypothetical protein
MSMKRNQEETHDDLRRVSPRPIPGYGARFPANLHDVEGHGMSRCDIDNDWLAAVRVADLDVFFGLHHGKGLNYAPGHAGWPESLHRKAWPMRS